MEAFAPIFQARNLLGFTDTDLHAAEAVCRLLDMPDENLFMATAVIGRALREGHTCLTFDYYRQVLESAQEVVEGLAADILERCRRIDENGWQRLLEPFNDDSTVLPLYADRSGRFYYFRLRKYEEILAAMVRERAGRSAGQAIDDTRIRQAVHGITLDDFQVQAVQACVSNALTVVNGGPGTGKTTLVAAVLLVLAAGPDEHRIALAAPTGKAAKRLGESVAAGCADAAAAVRERIPAEAVTLHRLLKCTADGTVFRYNSENPVPADVVIVDEASMIDIRMMQALFSALEPGTRLILLGDYNQLASVDAGSVLADICTAGSSGSLGHTVVALEKTYRFAAGQGIGALGRAVNAGDAGRVVEILTDDAVPDAVLYRADAPGALDTVFAPLVREWGVFRSAGTPEEALALLGRFRVLAAVHEGRRGVKALNALIKHLIVGQTADGAFYHGRPVIVLRNDYAHGVFNGDIGIAWQKGPDEPLLVRFDDGRAVSPQVLPEHASAYALSVHKSQGSEFENVLLVLPDAPQPVLSRQLLYTAATRAKEGFGVFGSEEVLKFAVETRAVRYSGLGELLKN